MAKLEWSFKYGEMRGENDYCYHDDRRFIVVRDSDEEMVFDKVETVELPDGYEGYKVLSFYSKDLETGDLMDEAKEDAAKNNAEVFKMLDLYEHVPTFDDSKAGKVFCAGEGVGFFGNYLVITTSYRLDM